MYRHYIEATRWNNKSVVFCFLFTFHFSLLFPVLFPPLCFPIVVPLYYSVALPRCWAEVLEPTVAKTDDLGLVPIFKKIFQKSVIFIFSFDLLTDIILKQLNKIKNMNIFFSLSFFSVVSPVLFPVVLRYCGPCCLTPLFTPLRRHRDSRGDRELLAFIFHQRARALAQSAHPDLLHWDHRPGETPQGDTTGRQRGNKTGTQNGKQNGKMKTKKK